MYFGVRGAELPLFFLPKSTFFAKKCIFSVKYLVHFGLSPLHLATRQYLRTPPGTSLPSVPFPRSYGRKMQPMTVIFLPKSTFFTKKMHFFRKIFGHVHFLLYLCTAFPPTCNKAWQKVRKTRLFSSVGQST